MGFSEIFLKNIRRIDSQLKMNCNNSNSMTDAFYCQNKVPNCSTEKYLWVIGSLSTRYPHIETVASFQISDDVRIYSIEFQPIHTKNSSGLYETSGSFRFSSSLINNQDEYKAESCQVNTRIHVLQNDIIANPSGEEHVVISKWMPVSDVGFYKFDSNKSILLSAISNDKLVGRAFINGKDYYRCLLVGMEFDFSNQFRPASEFELEKPEEQVMSTMHKLYNDKDFADVEIVTREKNEDGTITFENIRMAHKAVLSAQSTVFETALKTQDKNVRLLSQIEIADFEPKIVEELLKYLYIGSADLDNYALDLLKIADKYNIQKLMETCQKYIAAHIPKFGWTCIFELIQTYETRVSVLKEKVAQYYKKYETTLKQSPDFVTAMKEFPVIFCELYTL